MINGGFPGCNHCGRLAPMGHRSESWMCDTCSSKGYEYVKTLTNSVLSQAIVQLLTEIYEVLPEDRLSMEARDFIVELNDLEEPEELCIGLSDVLTCLENWQGREAEIAKMKIEEEYERLWALTGLKAGDEPTDAHTYRH